MGPIMTPMLKVMGSSRKARDWYLESICEQELNQVGKGRGTWK